jgi:tetratricopeptide (TPR) repeat protein
MGGPQAQVEYFISYTSADRAWAEWIAWQLKETGSSVVLQAWDMVPGLDFVHEMQKATTTSRRTIAVLSPAYFTSQFAEAEWRAAFADDPSGEQRRLIPVRVVDFRPPGLLRARIYIDLVGKDRQAARAALLEGVKPQPTAVPIEEPAFPGKKPAALEVFEPPQEEPRFPSALPSVWNVPYLRNRAFTGRQELLEELAAGLGEGTAIAIAQAIAGLGGVGKTSLAVEYAYRHQAAFDVVWWVRAEEPASLLGDFTALAGAIDLPEAGLPDPAVVVAAVHRWLASHDRWLLVFDNVTRPEDVTSLLPPAGGGQVLITSRWTAWGEWATPLQLNVMPRKEAVAYLRKRTGTSDEQAAAALAEALGDLPLALAEAAAYLERTQLGLDAYLRLVRERAVELFGFRQPTGAQRRVATVWSLSLEHVREEAPGAEALLELCAFLAPEDIPRNLPGEHPEVLPEELRELAGDPLAYNQTLGVIGDYSLATVTPTALGLHRLVQAVIRARLDDRGGQWAQIAVEVIDAAFPKDSQEVAHWPICQRLLPHLLAVADHAERLKVADEVTGGLLDRASAYLRSRGQPREARLVAERALAITQQALGPDHPTMGDRHNELGRALREAGDYPAARQHLERALAIDKTAYGLDDSRVGYRHNELGVLLWNLGDLGGARTHLERALEIGQATLGPDHPEVAIRHNNLGLVLYALGDLGGARTRHERALEITQATLGPDHPKMAIRHSNLGLVLADLGDLGGARIHHERALEIGQATLGPDQPNVAHTRSNLDHVLQQLGSE